MDIHLYKEGFHNKADLDHKIILISHMVVVQVVEVEPNRRNSF